MTDLATVPPLVNDDLGVRTLPTNSAEDLLELVMRRSERASTLLTSNRPVEDWGKLLGDTAAVSALRSFTVVADPAGRRRPATRGRDRGAVTLACESETLAAALNLGCSPVVSSAASTTTPRGCAPRGRHRRGVDRGVRAGAAAARQSTGWNVRVTLLIVPTSAAARSVTRRPQVPYDAVSPPSWLGARVKVLTRSCTAPPSRS